MEKGQDQKLFATERDLEQKNKVGNIHEHQSIWVEEEILKGEESAKREQSFISRQHKAEISQLKELYNAKLTIQYFFHTTKMLEQDERQKAEINQQLAELAELMAQIACVEAKSKGMEAKHKEEIRKKDSRQIEAINLIEAVHNVESKRQDDQHRKETRRQELVQTEQMVNHRVEMAWMTCQHKEAMVKQADCHRVEMKWMTCQHKEAMLNQASVREAEIERWKEEIKRLEEKLDDQHHISSFRTLVGSSIALVASIVTLVGSIWTLLVKC